MGTSLAMARSPASTLPFSFQPKPYPGRTSRRHSDQTAEGNERELGKEYGGRTTARRGRGRKREAVGEH